jgi:HD-GYP domain-containing protein (c-di-GMP phosphodiesterase class II)/HAMP domain-containing protein
MIALFNRARTNLPRMSLRERLTLLSLLGLAVFTASFGVIGALAITESTNQTMGERLASAQATAQYIDRLLTHSLTTLEDLAAKSPPAAQADPGGAIMATYLAEHFSQGDGYAFLAVLDAQGKLKVTVPSHPELATATLAGLAPELAPARFVGRPSVTNLLHLPGNANPFVWLAVPLSRDLGPATPMLVGALDLTDAAATYYVGLAHLSISADVQLVDANGMLLNHTQMGLRFTASEHQGLFRSLMEQGLATVATHSVPSGGAMVNRVIAFAPLRMAPWAVAVEQDEGDAFAVVNRLRWQLASLAIAFGVVIILLVWFATSRVLHPVGVLIQSAQRIASGDLATPVPAVGSDEIGDLAASFDAMRARLSESYRQVHKLYLQTKTRHTHEQTMLLRFSEDLLAMVDPQWALDRAAGVAATLASAEFASIVLQEQEHEPESEAERERESATEHAPQDWAGVVRAAFGWEQEIVGMPIAGSPQDMIGLAAAQRRSVMVTDFAEDQRFLPGDYMTAHGVRSGAAVPMLAGDRMIGILSVHSRRPDSFDQQDVDVLALVANQTALGLSKARLLAESSRRWREMTTLYDFSQTIGMALSVDELCERLVSALENTLGYDYVSVQLLGEGGELVSHAGSDRCQPAAEDAGRVQRQEPARPAVKAADADSVGETAARTGRVTRVDDLAKSGALVAAWPDARSEICVPVWAGDKVAGVISVGSRKLSAFSAEDERLLVALAGPAGIALERTGLFDDARRQAEEFASLYEIGTVMGSSLQLPQVLQSIVASALTLLDSDTCSIMLIDQARGELTMQACQGAMTGTPGEPCEKLGDGIAGWVAQSGEPLLVQGSALPSHLKNIAAREQVTSAISVPLKASGRTMGVLNVSSLGQRRFGEADVRLLSRLAADAALALDNARLYDELRRSFLETVAALAQAVDAKDPYTRGHSERVTDIAVAIGGVLGIGQDDLDTLRSAAVLHDIGKIGIAEQILRKPGPLDDNEWDLMRNHSQFGADIVVPVSSLQRAVPVILHHHERWDGKGYPDRLRGEAIPLGSRILAVADAYEAMTSDRAYRKAMPVEKAQAILAEGAGHQWEPRVVEAFLQIKGAKVR